MLKLIRIIFLNLLFLSTNLIGHAMDIHKSIHEVKNDVIALSEKESIKSDKKNDSKEESKEEPKEEQNVNPTNDYKLIGIYFVAKQPRALIKNELKPDDGAGEYKIGDYLDEEQNISVSKISFNPTARVELIDKNGLTYLMKPYAVDEGQGGSKKTTTSTKSFPTYSSAGSSTKSKLKDKLKEKEEGSVEAAIKAGEPSVSPTATPPPLDKAELKEETQQPSSIKAAVKGSSESTEGPKEVSKPQEAAKTSNTPSSTTTSTTSLTTGSGSSSSSDAGSGLDESRPANPFGE